MTVTVYYAMIDPNAIFGMVGRCGGGYNTVWEDWRCEGREARELIMKEYEQGLNDICGHYARLEKSVAEEGFRNPCVITCGKPQRRSLKNIPPEMFNRPIEEWLLLEGVTGGSRLWVAQQLGIKVPCIVNDFTGKFSAGMRAVSARQIVTQFYKDQPRSYRLDHFRGFVEQYDNTQQAYHMDPAWREENVVKLRAPLWVKTMNKYGYYVDRLQPFVLKILQEAGVTQPAYLKNRFPQTKFYATNPSL